jgi:hypothetical protein
MKRMTKLLTATAIAGALALVPMSSANAFWGFPFFGGGGGFSFGMNFGGGLGGWGYPGWGWGGYPGYGWGGYPGYGWGGYPGYGWGGYPAWGGYGLPYAPYLPAATVAAPATKAEK